MQTAIVHIQYITFTNKSISNFYQVSLYFYDFKLEMDMADKGFSPDFYSKFQVFSTDI